MSSDLVIPTLSSLPVSSAKKKQPVKAQAIDHAAGDDKASFIDAPIEHVTASKTNPRKIFDDAALADLAASIGKHGVAQPILLRPTHVDAGITYYEVVAGERRFRASKLAGKTTVPAIVRNLSDAEALEIQVIENLQRQDLHPLEEAEGFEVLMRENGYTADVMAEKTGKSKAYIYASLKLCALEPKPRASFYAGDLTKSTALLVARIPVKRLQEECVSVISKGYGGPMSTRNAADYIERTYMLHLKKASFKPSDATLCPAAGSCTTCPNRTGNQPEIFADVNADVCTDPGCYKTKTEVNIQRTKDLALQAGQTVITGADAKKIMPSSYGDLRAGYVDLDKTNYSDPKHRTYRQILGKQAPVATILENPHNDTLLEIVKLADITSVMQEKGIKLGVDTGPSHSEREKEQERAAKLEREYRTKVFEEVHHASLMMNLIDADLRIIAVQMFNNLPSGTIPTKLVMSLHGWTDETFSYPDRAGKLKAAIADLTPAALNQFIRACSLSHELHVHTYTATSKDTPENLLAMAARVKVDAKAIHKDLRAAAKAKEDAKKAAAEKKSAKGKAKAVSVSEAKPAQAAVPSGPIEVPMDSISINWIEAFFKDLASSSARLNATSQQIVQQRPDLVTAFHELATAKGHTWMGGKWFSPMSKSTQTSAENATLTPDTEATPQ